MNEDQTLNNGQVALIRTLWELAQGRVDALYDLVNAELEKRAIEEWITRVFPSDCESIVRSDSQKVCV